MPSLFGYSFPGFGAVNPVVFPPVPGASAQSQLSPFFIGPGFSPVHPKLVAAIVSGKFVELSTLSEDPSEHDTPSFSVLVNQVVLQPRKRCKLLTDIVMWLQAFAITLILMAYFPARSSDLLHYQLLILCTAQQFPGSVWWSYDRAFHRGAAAMKQNDWSQMNPELFHFHVSSATSASTLVAGSFGWWLRLPHHQKFGTPQKLPVVSVRKLAVVAYCVSFMEHRSVLVSLSHVPISALL